MGITVRALVLASTLMVAACGQHQLVTAVPAAPIPDPALTVGDTGTLGDSDVTVKITLTLTCPAGYNALGSAAVSDNSNALDVSQSQGYSGLVRVSCTGQPQDLPLTLVSGRTPFRVGPALARAAFTLNLCDPNCRSASITKTITNTR
jgi:hypothetical protein